MKPKDIDRRTWVIYSLGDPFTHEVRYVGWTVDLDKRVSRHWRTAISGVDKSYRGRWLRTLAAKPLVAVLESGTGASYAEKEVYWIARMKFTGARLTNATIGGDGVLGCVFSDTERLRRRNVRLGAKASDETRARISASQLALGRRLTPENKAKLAEAKKNFVMSDEQRATLRTALINRHWKMPEEMKRRLTAIHKGKTVSAETREKLSLACSGRQHTESEKQKMREAWAKRKQAKGTFQEMSRKWVDTMSMELFPPTLDLFTK